MKKFKVTMMIPQERMIEASDIQEAHNQMTKLINHTQGEKNIPHPIMHSIVEVVSGTIIEFGPSPAA